MSDLDLTLNSDNVLTRKCVVAKGENLQSDPEFKRLNDIPVDRICLWDGLPQQEFEL